MRMPGIRGAGNIGPLVLQQQQMELDRKRQKQEADDASVRNILGMINTGFQGVKTGGDLYTGIAGQLADSKLKEAQRLDIPIRTGLMGRNTAVEEARGAREDRAHPYQMDLLKANALKLGADTEQTKTQTGILPLKFSLDEKELLGKLSLMGSQRDVNQAEAESTRVKTGLLPEDFQLRISEADSQSALRRAQQLGIAANTEQTQYQTRQMPAEFGIRQMLADSTVRHQGIMGDVAERGMGLEEGAQPDKLALLKAQTLGRLAETNDIPLNRASQTFRDTTMASDVAARRKNEALDNILRNRAALAAEENVRIANADRADMAQDRKAGMRIRQGELDNSVTRTKQEYERMLWADRKKEEEDSKAPDALVLPAIKASDEDLEQYERSGTIPSGSMSGAAEELRQNPSKPTSQKVFLKSILDTLNDPEARRAYAPTLQKRAGSAYNDKMVPEPSDYAAMAKDPEAMTRFLARLYALTNDDQEEGVTGQFLKLLQQGGGGNIDSKAYRAFFDEQARRQGLWEEKNKWNFPWSADVQPEDYEAPYNPEPEYRSGKRTGYPLVPKAIENHAALRAAYDRFQQFNR